MSLLRNAVRADIVPSETKSLESRERRQMTMFVKRSRVHSDDVSDKVVARKQLTGRERTALERCYFSMNARSPHYCRSATC